MLPPRVNEVIGVSHVKAYIFDDDVIISGANLSSDYFTVRQAEPCSTNNPKAVLPLGQMMPDVF